MSMRRMIVGFAGCLAMGLLPGAALGAGSGDADLIEFEQTCDASALVFTLGDQLLVADDMTDVLHTYRPTGGKPFARHDLYPHTHTPRRSRRPFSAFEGAARLGDKIYFITSHAREDKGKNRPNRRRLLALQSTQIANVENVEPTGVSYTDLKAQLSSAPELRSVALGSAIMELHRQLPYLSPKVRGLNIEGLAAGKDGQSLLVALRNPRRGGLALIVPIENPDRVILGYADPAFGAPIQLDLGGLGITGMSLDPGSGVYYILAGRHDAPGSSQLYRWTGEPGDAPVPLGAIGPDDFEAQAVAVSPDGERLMVLSDDGERRIPVENADQCSRKPDAAGTCQCNQLAEPALKRFRGQWIPVPPAKPAATKPAQ